MDVEILSLSPAGDAPFIGEMTMVRKTRVDIDIDIIFQIWFIFMVL